MKKIVHTLGFIVPLPFVFYFLHATLQPLWNISDIALLAVIASVSLLLCIGALLRPHAYATRLIRTYANGVLNAVVFSLLLADAVLLLDDARRGILSFIGHESVFYIPRSDILVSIAGVIGFGLCLVFILGMMLGPRILRVRRISIPLRNLAHGLEGYRILQISDMHIGTFLSDGMITRVLKVINQEKPDLVVFTGDMVNNRAEEMLPFMDTLAKFPQTIAILGNHDYGDYVSWKNDTDKRENLLLLQEHIRSLGWILLNNDRTMVEKNGAQLAIAGVENWSAMARFPKYGDLTKALTDIPENVPVVLLSHDPTHWRAEVLDHSNVALTLSGHTHAMQFGILGKHIRWSPSQWIFKEWAGLYTKNNQHLYVNVGIGMLGFPGRVGAWSEVTIHTLTNKKDHAH